MIGRDEGTGQEDVETFSLVVSRGHELAVVPYAEGAPGSPVKIFVPSVSSGIVTQALEGLEE